MRERIAGHSNALSRGLGSARPEVSIRIWSGSGSSCISASIVGMKSSATVQQIQPLASSTIFSSGQLGIAQLFRISPSTPTSPNSFTITANRLSVLDCISWLIRVVFPEPRKPVITVTGSFVRFCMIVCSYCHSVSDTLKKGFVQSLYFYVSEMFIHANTLSIEQG